MTFKTVPSALVKTFKAAFCIDSDKYDWKQFI